MNVKAPHLALDEAREAIRTLGAAWVTNENDKLANAEGWNIFNLPDRLDRDPTDAGIEAYDPPLEGEGSSDPIDFPNGDDDVIAHCRKRAAEGSIPHATALRIEHALNSIRFHLWGEEWVDSRIGPHHRKEIGAIQNWIDGEVSAPAPQIRDR